MGWKSFFGLLPGVGEVANAPWDAGKSITPTALSTTSSPPPVTWDLASTNSYQNGLSNSALTYPSTMPSLLSSSIPTTVSVEVRAVDLPSNTPTSAALHETGSEPSIISALATVAAISSTATAAYAGSRSTGTDTLPLAVNTTPATDFVDEVHVQRDVGESTTAASTSSIQETSSSAATASAGSPMKSGNVLTPFTGSLNGPVFRIYFGYAQKDATYQDGDVIDLQKLRDLISSWDNVNTAALQRNSPGICTLYKVTKDIACLEAGRRPSTTSEVTDFIKGTVKPGGFAILTPLFDEPDEWLFDEVCFLSCPPIKPGMNAPCPSNTPEVLARNAAPLFTSTISTSGVPGSALVTVPASVQTQWTSQALGLTVTEVSTTYTTTMSSFSLSTSCSGPWLFEPSTTLHNGGLAAAIQNTRSTFLEPSSPFLYEPSTSSTLATFPPASSKVLNPRINSKEPIHDLLEHHAEEEIEHTVTETVTVPCAPDTAHSEPVSTSTTTVDSTSTITRTSTAKFSQWTPGSGKPTNEHCPLCSYGIVPPSKPFDFGTTTFTPDSLKTKTHGRVLSRETTVLTAN